MLIQFLADERMNECLINGDAFRWVEHETLFEKVLQLVNLSEVSVIEALRTDQTGEEVARGERAHHSHLLLRGGESGGSLHNARMVCTNEKERARERERGRERERACV